MTQQLGQILEKQKIYDLTESDQIAGAGASANYIMADDIQAPVSEPSVAVDISGVRSSLSSSQTSQISNNPEGDLKEDLSNYILNRPITELLGLDKAPPPPPPPNDPPADPPLPPNDTPGNHDQLPGDGDTSYIYEYTNLDGLDENSTNNDVIKAIGNEAEDTVDDYSDKDFYTNDDHNYMVVNSQRLQDWYDKLKILTNLMILLQILMKARQEHRNVVFEEMTGLVADKGMDTATIVGKWAQNRLMHANVAFQTLLEKVKNHNDDVYKKEQEAANRKDDDCGDTINNMITGNGATIEKLKGLRDAADHYCQATTAMLSILQGSVEKPRNRQMGDSDIGVTNGVLRNGELQLLSQLPYITGNGENDYLELDGEELDKLKKGVAGIQNMKQVLNIINDFKDELRSLVHQEMTEVSGRSKSQLAKKPQEMESMRTSAVLDTIVGFQQQKIQQYNSKIYLQNQVDKMDNFGARFLNILSFQTTLAAIVCSFFPGWGTIAAIVLGLLAACMKLGAAAIGHAMEKDYQPDYVSQTNQPLSANTGNPTVDIMNETANLEDKILQKADQSFIDNAGDGFVELNSQRIADLQKQLEKMANIRRAVVALHKEKASMRKLVHMEMTGVGSYDNSDFIDQIDEAEIKQIQFELDLRKFMLNELITAQNIRVASDKQMDAAFRSFGISTATSVAAGCIGAAASGGGEAAAAAGTAGASATSMTATEGFALGWSIGGAIGNFAAEILNQTVWGSYGVSYGDANISDYMAALKKSDNNSVDNRLQALEVNIYEDALANGINKNTGDGNWGINGDYLAQLRNKLGFIANIKSCMAALDEAKADIRNLVHAEMTGISGRKAGVYVREVNQGEFDASLRIFDSMVQFMGQRIEVNRRSVDAGKAMTNAAIKLGIDAAIIAAGTSLGQGGVTLYEGASPSLFYSLISPVMQFVNSTYDFVYNLVKSQSGDGSLKNYNAGTVAREIIKADDPDAAQNRLEQLEQDAYAQIAQELIEEVGGGRWGLNFGMQTAMRHEMEGVLNIRDVMIKINNAQAEMRNAVHAAMTGAGGRNASLAVTAAGIDRGVVLSNLSNLFQVLQIMVDRHNQMNDAERAMFMALVGMALAAASIYLTCRSSTAEFEYKKDYRDYALQAKAIKDFKAEMASVTNPSHEQIQDQNGRLLQKTEVMNQKYNQVTKAYEVTEKWSRIQTIVALVQAMIPYFVGRIYDAAKGGRESNAAEHKVAVATVAVKGQSKWVASVNASEQEALNSSLSAGDTDLDTQALEIGKREGEEFVEGLKSLGTTLLGMVKKWLFKPTLVKNYEQRKKDEERAKGAVPAEGVNPSSQTAVAQAPQIAAQTPFNPKNVDQNVARTQALLGRLDNLIQQADEAGRRVTAAKQQAGVAKAKVDKLQNQIQNNNNGKPTDLQTQLKAAINEWEAAKGLYQQAFDDLKSCLTQTHNAKLEAVRLMAEIDAQVKGIDGKINSLLKSKDPNAAAEVKQLRAKKALLENAKPAIKTKVRALNERTLKARENLAQARQAMQLAAKNVGLLKLQIENLKKNNGTLMENAVARIDNQPKQNSNGGNKNPYKSYQEAQREEAMAQAALNNASNLNIAA